MAPREKSLSRLGTALAALALAAGTTAALAAPAAAARHPSAVNRPAAGAAHRPHAHSVRGRVTGGTAHALARSEPNLVAGHRRLITSLRRHAAVPAAQLHQWWGVFPGYTAGDGLEATQSVEPDLRLSEPGDVLYTPTAKPPDGSCIEVVTVHTTGTPQVWAWDWCDRSGPQAEVNIDGAFLSRYGTTVHGRQAYTMRDVQTDASTNTWTASLYDYATGSWDTLYTSQGQDRTGLYEGWDMYEFYSATNPATGDTYVCDDIRNAGVGLESSGIKLRTGGEWVPTSPGNSTWQPSRSPDPTQYECPYLDFQVVSDSDDWVVSEGA